MVTIIGSMEWEISRCPYKTNYVGLSPTAPTKQIYSYGAGKVLGKALLMLLKLGSIPSIAAKDNLGDTMTECSKVADCKPVWRKSHRGLESHWCLLSKFPSGTWVMYLLCV